MVKESRYTTLALAALLLAAACTQQEPVSTYRDDPDAVRISAQVGNGEGSPATRSNPVGVLGEECSFNSGDRVCVTADGQPEVVYAYDGSSWTPQEDKFLKWNTPTMNFTAWYPAAEGVNADNFTVPADQSNEAKIAAADYMTCSQQITRDGDNPVSLNFERRMARIVVIPSFNNQFNSVDYTVSEITVCGNTNGYASGGPASGSVEVKAYNNNGLFYALLSPTSASSATFIKVKVKKNDGTEEHSLEAKGIIATEAGKSYIVNLTVGKNVASVARVTVSDWVATYIPASIHNEAMLSGA
ncbi:MAG: fimbrillin family protein, partial [Candidatus Cryptobacteroides sp.]